MTEADALPATPQGPVAKALSAFWPAPLLEIMDTSVAHLLEQMTRSKL